jgi:hypothetical protein
MHDQEAERRPYTKLIGPEILAQDYSDYPIDRRLYGRWRCSDGREVLFNRSYRRDAPASPWSGPIPRSGSEGIIGDADYFWTDGRGTNEQGHRLLREWGIA